MELHSGIAVTAPEKTTILLSVFPGIEAGFMRKIKCKKGGIVLAKKHNKSRKQKPNYSKRGITNVNVEAGADLELGQKLTDKTCMNNDKNICDRTSKKK